MASTVTTIFTEAGPPVPAMGTLPSAANQMFPKGTIVTRNGAGAAVSPSSADASGFPAMGVSNAFFDNRTGSEAGGGAGDLDIEVTYGVFAFAYVTGDGTPLPGDIMFVVDNQTVSKDSNASARGVAGYCSEVRDGFAHVWFGPHVMGQVEEIDLAVAEAAIADLEADVAEGHISVPIPTTAFANGTANGLDPSVMGFRYNDTIDNQPLRAIVALPDDIDAGEDVVVTARAYIIDDETDDDVVMVLVAKIDGGSDVAPVSAVVLGEAAAEISFTIDAADVPAGAKALYLELDCADTLDTSDAVLEALQVTCTRTIASA